MSNGTSPSFSRGRKLSLSLNLVVSLLAVIALVVMVNHLAARHHWRWSWSARSQADLSPLTLRVLGGVTNTVRVTLYFDKRQPFYEMSWNLLKAYRLANYRIQLETVDYLTEPGAAQLVKARCKQLGETDRDVVIFDGGQNRVKIVSQKELTILDLEKYLSRETDRPRRTHFKGESLFTSAILNVTSSRQLKAYFIEGHQEHDPESEDSVRGYSRFAGVFGENNIQLAKLNLSGTNDVPADCHLLVIAGPRLRFSPEALERIDRYLKQGGRLLALLNSETVLRPTGVEKILARWGVAVGNNFVIDQKNSDSQDPNCMLLSSFQSHPMVTPLFGGQVYMVLPRSVKKDLSGADNANALQVDALIYTSQDGQILTDIRPDGTAAQSTTDFVGNVPLVVVVERGGIRNVTADRGTTRLVVTGDSFFLNNNNINREANHQLASDMINWLLARNDLLVPVPPKPIAEYKVTMTDAQMTATHWVLMGAFPGSALVLGLLVWLRRRR